MFQTHEEMRSKHVTLPVHVSKLIEENAARDAAPAITNARLLVMIDLLQEIVDNTKQIMENTKPHGGGSDGN